MNKLSSLVLISLLSACEVEPQVSFRAYECTLDSECAGACYIIPLFGGMCGECADSSDCELGCTPATPFHEDPAICGDGLAGDGCDSNDHCMDGFVCAKLMSAGGLIERSTCGECIVDGDCGVREICAPMAEANKLAGFRSCVKPHTLQLGAMCDRDVECGSGRCAETDMSGLITIGVCGECADDGDCGQGTCSPGYVSELGAVPSMCV